MGNDNLKPEMNSRQVQSKDSSFLVQSAGLAVFRLVKDDTNNAEQRVEWLLLQDNPRLISNFTLIRGVLFEFHLKFWNTASIGIPVRSKVDRLLTGLAAQQKGTTA